MRLGDIIRDALGTIDLRDGKLSGEHRPGRRSTEIKLHIVAKAKGAPRVTVAQPPSLRSNAAPGARGGVVQPRSSGAAATGTGRTAIAQQQPAGGGASVATSTGRGAVAQQQPPPGVTGGRFVSATGVLSFARSGFRGLGQPTIVGNPFTGGGGGGAPSSGGGADGSGSGGAPPGGGAAAGGDTTPGGSDTGYQPNGKVWLSANPVPFFWDDGTPVNWPDGTPMIGRMWLPSMDVSQLDGNLPSNYPRWYLGNTARYGGGGSYGSRSDFIVLQAISDLTWYLNVDGGGDWDGLGATLNTYPGFRFLGSNVGGISDTRVEDAIADYVTAKRGSNSALTQQLYTIAAALRDGNPWGNDPALQGADQHGDGAWNVLPNTPIIGRTNTFGPQVKGDAQNLGYVLDYGTSERKFNLWIDNAWDWSTVDPTTQAYPYLYFHHHINSFPGWAQMPADFWRSDGQSFAQGVPSSLPSGPLCCVEFLDALVTGAHGVPIIVDDQGHIDQSKLYQLINIASYTPLQSVLFKQGAPVLLATIYDTIGPTGIATPSNTSTTYFNNAAAVPGLPPGAQPTDAPTDPNAAPPPDGSTGTDGSGVPDGVTPDPSPTPVPDPTMSGAGGVLTTPGSSAPATEIPPSSDVPPDYYAPPIYDDSAQQIPDYFDQGPPLDVTSDAGQVDEFGPAPAPTPDDGSGGFTIEQLAQAIIDAGGSFLPFIPDPVDDPTQDQGAPSDDGWEV